MRLVAKGYKLKSDYNGIKKYTKTYNFYDVEVVIRDKEIISKKVIVGAIHSQKELDNVQIALNNLERDIK